MSQDIDEILGIQGIMDTVQVIASNGEPMTLLDGLNHELVKLVRKSAQFKKGSKLTMTLNLTPGNFNALNISAALGVREPEVQAAPMVAYTDARGNLHEEDVTQAKLDLGKVSQMERKQV